MSRVPHFCLYALSLYRSAPTVIRRRRVPTPGAAPVWPATLVSIGTRRLYNETTVRLRRRRRCDVLLVCRCVRNNKMFLYEPCSFLLTLEKPSTIGVQLTWTLRSDVQSKQWVTGSDPWPTDPHKNWPMTHYAWPMTHQINKATTHFIKPIKKLNTQ